MFTRLELTVKHSASERLTFVYFSISFCVYNSTGSTFKLFFSAIGDRILIFVCEYHRDFLRWTCVNGLVVDFFVCGGLRFETWGVGLQSVIFYIGGLFNFS